jgi:hypothetical protein
MSATPKPRFSLLLGDDDPQPEQAPPAPDAADETQPPSSAPRVPVAVAIPGSAEHDQREPPASADPEPEPAPAARERGATQLAPGPQPPPRTPRRGAGETTPPRPALDGELDAAALSAALADHEQRYEQVSTQLPAELRERVRRITRHAHTRIGVRAITSQLVVTAALLDALPDPSDQAALMSFARDAASALDQLDGQHSTTPAAAFRRPLALDKYSTYLPSGVRRLVADTADQLRAQLAVRVPESRVISAALALSLPDPEDADAISDHLARLPRQLDRAATLPRIGEP